MLALEGGYSYEGLAASVEAVTRVLLEDPAPPGEGGAARPPGLIVETPLGIELSDAVRRAQRDYWKALQ